MPRCVRCGKKHPFLKVDPNAICLDCYKAELKLVKATLSEMNASASELNSQIYSLNQQLRQLRLALSDSENQQTPHIEKLRLAVEREEVVMEYDTRLEEAVQIVIETGQASVSMLQRRMRVGYARAGRLIDEMERRGIVSEVDGVKPRKVLISRFQPNSENPSV